MYESGPIGEVVVGLGRSYVRWLGVWSIHWTSTAAQVLATIKPGQNSISSQDRSSDV